MPGLGDLVKVLRRFLKAKQAAILHGDGPGCGVCVCVRGSETEKALASSLFLESERASESIIRRPYCTGTGLRQCRVMDSDLCIT